MFKTFSASDHAQRNFPKKGSNGYESENVLSRKPLDPPQRKFRLARAKEADSKPYLSNRQLDVSPEARNTLSQTDSEL